VLSEIRQTTVELAGRLKQDIRDRRLCPGDAYLSASEAAMLLRVSKHRANRALQLLAAQCVLRRGRGSAPIVARVNEANVAAAELDSIHILLPQIEMSAEGLYSDGALIGMQRELPNVNIQLNYYPIANDGRFTEELIHKSLASGERAGFVLVRSSFDAQLAAMEGGLPTVIHGSPFPGIDNIPWMERDYDKAARLHADYMRRHGCDRVSLMMRDTAHAGDQTFHDALRVHLHGFGYDNDAIAIRFCPPHEKAATTFVERDRRRAGTRLGVVAVGGRMAELTAGAMARLGLKPYEDVCLSYRGFHASGPPALLHIAHDQDMIEPQDQGRKLAQMLVALAAQSDIGTAGLNVVIDMRFVEPCAAPDAPAGSLSFHL